MVDRADWLRPCDPASPALRGEAAALVRPMWPCSPPSIASPSGMLIGMGGVAGLEPTMFSGVSSGAFNAAPERVELGVGAGTEDGGVDEQLDLTGAVAQHGEGEPTLPAQQREPAGDPHAVIGDLVRAEPGVRGPDLLDRVVGGVAVRQPPVDVGVGRHDPHNRETGSYG